ncbi:MAG: L-glutamate gamma-semialdehyde dehydrogenase, partial [Planctomycetota bacterium]
ESARAAWADMAWEHRASVLLKSAALLQGAWRDRLNASTMLNQSKTCFQAEIDAACELIDFWKFNNHFALNEIHPTQPISPPGVWNSVDYRPLEGFVYAVTPFNFTSIAGNLPGAPALMGNVSIWKPSDSAVLSNHHVMKLLEEAGLPPGVIQFVPGPAEEVTTQLLAQPDFAGLHFTGSTAVFRELWRRIAEGLPHYRSYPRIVGETGGKDFIFVHPSADPTVVAVAALRGAFEYQGQKCSAASRMYVPRSLWPEIRDQLVARMESLRMGDPRDFGNFMAAVIHEQSFERITAAIGEARASSAAEVVQGGGADRETGWFVEPTLIECTDPRFTTMEVELFGPVLSTFVYDDEDIDATLALCDGTSPYALTGAIFSSDRVEADRLAKTLRHAAGNFYVNDKPTGAVVGQQPFGGGRASGTDDKAGSALNLLRWVAPRTIKETFLPPSDHRYPHMG